MERTTVSILRAALSTSSRLGGGGVASFIYALIELFSNSYSFLYILLRGGTAAMLTAVACYAIYAFYSRRSDSVAIAKTYIVMVVIDGIIGGLMLLIVGEYGEIKSVARQFVWATIWFLYLTHSTQVEELFPLVGRTWGKIEKYALVIFTLCYLTLLSMIWVQTSTNVLLNDEAYIEQAVSASQTELPIAISDEVEMTGIEYADGTLHYSYRVTIADKNNFYPEYMDQHTEELKQEQLTEWPDIVASDEFMALCCKKQLVIQYSYYDKNFEHLYDIVISPEEYNGLLDKVNISK